jgi:hypothetical protein
MPRKRKLAKRRARQTRFSPELENFLAGDDSAFSDPDVFDDIWWCLFIEEGRERSAFNALLTQAEKRRVAQFEEERQKRDAARTLEHYRHLSESNGCSDRWRRHVADGEDPAFAFQYALQESIAERSSQRRQQEDIPSNQTA